MIKRLAAGLTILGLLVGLPLVLVALNAGPLDLPSWETIRGSLTRPDDGTVLLSILKAAGWIVWAALAVSIMVEIVARLRGVTAPRMPGLGLPQKLARGLVGAVALTALAAPVAANAAPAAAPLAAVAVHTPTMQTPAGHPAAAAAPAVKATDVKTPSAKGAAETPSISHIVARGETLWALAERYLGEGTRFREIVDLNPDTLSGRGDFLRPGWTLRIPAPPSSYTVKAGDTLSAVAARFLGDPDRAEEIMAASRDTDQPDGQRLTDPDLIRPGWILTLPNPAVPAGEDHPAPSTTTHREAPAPVKRAQAVDPEAEHAAPAAPPPAPVPSAPSSPASAPAPSSSAPATEQTPAAAAEADDDTPWAPMLPIGVGTVLAAGVVTVLNRRRRDQQRTRRPGQRLPAPAAPDQQLERALRAGENPLDDVAAALRGLAGHFHGATLPTVRAGRVTPTHLDLYLESPATLPQPWVSAGDATVWTIPLTDIQSPEDPATPAAPWPTLVTIGRDDEDGYVLLDLETLAALTVTPGAHATRAVEILTALAVDLATSRWADDLRVTIVGACADLEDALQTGRIRYVPTAARVLDELEQRAGADQAALAAAGMSSLQQARAHGLAPDAWIPDILITTTPLTDTQQQRLTRLLHSRPRTAIAAVTLQTPASEWSLDLDATDPTLAVLQPIGLRIRPQYLPRASYQALLKVADLTHPAEVVTVEDQAHDEPTLSTVPATPAALLPITTSGGSSPADLPTIQPIVHVDVDDNPDDVDDATPALAPEVVDEAPLVDGPTPAADQATAPVDEGVDEGEGLGPVVISVLGPITLTGARGTCEPARRARLTEFAVYLALHPGVSHTDIDDAIWPNRKTEDNTATRHPVSTRLRNWLGLADDGLEFFPRHQGDDIGYVLHGVRTDVEQWDALIQGRPLAAPTENLAAALALVRGRPFTGQRIRYYAWADPIKQRLIAEIVDASYDLGRRYYMAGDYPGCEKALTIGLDIDPGQERLHRLRILARHDAHDITGQQEAIDRLMVIADELDCELEPETEDLLADLSDPARLDDARTAI